MSIPPQAVVQIPGHGRGKLQDALTYGGPSLLVQTVEDLTHVQINHYARIDFNHVANVVNVMNGVDVTLPDAATSFGYSFHVGVNHLGGVAALDYARQTSLTEEGRVLRQQSLIRAVIHKLYVEHLLTNPVTMYRVLHALIGMLTVDSNFTNAELQHLALEIRGLTGPPPMSRPRCTTSAGPCTSGQRHHPPALGGHPAGRDRRIRQEVSVHRDPSRAPLSPSGWPAAVLLRAPLTS